MKNFLSLFLVLVVFTANASEDTNVTTTKTEVFTKYGNKRAKRRAQRRYGIYHSKCMRTKRIRVRN